MKNYLAHDIYVARQYDIKMLGEKETILVFRVFSTEVNKAFIQSAEA